MSFNDTSIFQDNLSLVIDERISMRYWWNESDTAKPKNSEGNHFQCHFVRYKSRKDRPKVAPVHHVDRPAKHRHSHVKPATSSVYLRDRKHAAFEM